MNFYVICSPVLNPFIADNFKRDLNTAQSQIETTYRVVRDITDKHQAEVSEEILFKTFLDFFL